MRRNSAPFVLGFAAVLAACSHAESTTNTTGAGGTSTSTGDTSTSSQAATTSSAGGGGGGPAGSCEALGGVCQATGTSQCDGFPPIAGAEDCSVCCKKPIKYVIVVVKENHTFDNYFSGFPGADPAPTTVVDKGTNAAGVTYTRKALTTATTVCDLPHTHPFAVSAYNAGKMNHFTDGSPPGGNSACLQAHPSLPFQYFTQAQIPNYWKYAKGFTLADHFHASMLTQSSPGHLAVTTSQSPLIQNPHTPNNAAETAVLNACPYAGETEVADTYNPTTGNIKTSCPRFDIPAIYDDLPAGYDWRAYGPGPNSTPLVHVKSYAQNYAQIAMDHMRAAKNLPTDLETFDTPGHPKQPNLIIADVSGGSYSNQFGSFADISEHPVAGAGDPCGGENYSVDVVNAAMKGPHWDETAIIITWDDWGGWYDHVTPTVQDHPAQTNPLNRYFNVGFRVPAIIISPYARKGFVLHTPTEQASIPRLIEDLFGMPRMHVKDKNARDEQAGSLLGAFDFTQAPLPPLILTGHKCN